MLLLRSKSWQVFRVRKLALIAPFRGLSAAFAEIFLLLQMFVFAKNGMWYLRQHCITRRQLKPYRQMCPALMQLLRLGRRGISVLRGIACRRRCWRSLARRRTRCCQAIPCSSSSRRSLSPPSGAYHTTALFLILVILQCTQARRPVLVSFHALNGGQECPRVVDTSNAPSSQTLLPLICSLTCTYF